MDNSSDVKDLNSDIQNEANSENENSAKIEDQDIESVKTEGLNIESEDKEEVKENAEDEMTPDSIIKELEVFNRKLKDENKKLTSELDVIKDRLARVSAEYDNFRKRTIKEKEGIYNDACSDVLKNVLPALDSLEKAIDVEGNAEDIKKGIEMTIKMFQSSLEKLEIEEISTEEGFNPNFHNAVMHVEDENYGKNQIIEVFQKGYKRGDKVIRYSMVKVVN
ncbi:MAG: nucleotide exchange factor GrpE [Bacillota bacterium]|nr:nucleotide exchange factor GrpE [Bacillota bacterium]